MKKLHLNSRGMTAIELLVGLLLVAIVATVALTNIRTVRAENRDTKSKTDINTLAFQLESFYQKSGFYPSIVSVDTLPTTDTEIFKDSHAKTIGKDSTLYTYEPLSCLETKCKGFKLTAELEREALYVKQSLNN